MFITAVPGVKKRAGLMARLRRLHQEKGTARYCEQDGIAYYIMEIAKKKGAFNFNELRTLYPRFCGRVLLAPTLSLPDELEALGYSSQGYVRQLMLKACMDVSKLLPLPLIRRSIGLVDEDGIYASFTETLIKYSPVVKVFTQKPERYRDTCRALLEQYGAPVVITEHLASLGDCVLVFSPDSLSMDAQVLSRALVVAGGRPQDADHRENTLCLHSLAASEAQLALVPGGIDPVDFFGAACELCGKRELYSLRPAAFFAGRRVIAAGELTKHIHAFFLYTRGGTPNAQ
ncbi:MAG: hypothetical protein ACERKO_08285 [Acetanaerobacterium sp.]